MPSTISYSFGAIVLVAFPFTNQVGSKQRPAVVVSADAYSQQRPDVILMAVTSQMRRPPAFGEVVIQHWQAAGLLKPSAIKPVLFTAEQRLVRRSLGQLTAEDQQALRAMIARLLG